MRPIKDLLRASDFVRGVADEGNGTETGLEVRVIAEGVQAESVGEGGKRKRVWEGVGRADLGMLGACGGCCVDCDNLRVWRETGTVARDSFRLRGIAKAVETIGVGTALTGESGTVGKMSRGVGLRLVFEIGR